MLAPEVHKAVVPLLATLLLEAVEAEAQSAVEKVRVEGSSNE